MKRTRVVLALGLGLVFVFALTGSAMAAKPQPQITSASATATGATVNQYVLSGTFTGRPYAWNYVVHYGYSNSSHWENWRVTSGELRSKTLATRMVGFPNTPVSIDLVIFDRKGNVLDTRPCTMQ